MTDRAVNPSGPSGATDKASPRTGRSRAKSPPGGRSSLRGEQQRSIESRNAILVAALSEFADKGYDATSIRSIGERAGLHFTLVTYHFKNKRKLWEAAVSHFFEEINDSWQSEMATMSSDDPLDLLRHQFHSFLRFTVRYPDFHRTILHENRHNSPRLDWVIRYFVKPIMDATIPNIVKAQKNGSLQQCDHVLFYYMILGACAALSANTGEIEQSSDLDTKSEATISEYWNIIDAIIFKRIAPASADPV